MIQIPPSIKQDIDAIDEVSRDLQMKIYIVGGFVRDSLFGMDVNDDTDLDITEANGNAFDLAFFVSAKYNLPEPIIYESTGTALVIMPSGREIEFHNAYYNVPHIIDQLYSLGVKPTSLNKDVYSRDFTINTILLDPENGEVHDLTGMGISDIEHKILRTPLPPSKTLFLDPKRILRGIRFKIQFGLQEDPVYTETVPKFIPTLIKFLQEHPQSDAVQKTVEKTMAMDSSRAFDEYNKLGIMEYLPKNEDMDKIIKENFLGKTITPVVLKIDSSNNLEISVAQTKMIKHLLEERDHHKQYVQRKKREKQKHREKEFEILEKARTGYYAQGNPEVNGQDRKRKETGRPGYEFVPKKRRG
jgi:tRNA nucleotidyltransferase/poly(A) polymerase